MPWKGKAWNTPIEAHWGRNGKDRVAPRGALFATWPGLILAASGAEGTLGGTTPLLWQTSPRTSELSRALVRTARWFSKAGGHGLTINRHTFSPGQGGVGGAE